MMPLIDTYLSLFLIQLKVLLIAFIDAKIHKEKDFKN